MRRTGYAMMGGVALIGSLALLLAARGTTIEADNFEADNFAEQEQDKYSRRTPIVEAFDRNKEAVVSISGRQITQRREMFLWDLEDWSFFQPRPRATPFLGSGFIIDEEGYIVTNAHVVEDAVEIKVTLSDGSEHEGKVVVADSSVDLALIKIYTDLDLPGVTLRKQDDLMIGETVLAIGNPFGLQHTLTDGIISAIHEDMEIERTKFPQLIQLSAPINPGNSGGPLLNINGEVIGINTAIRRAAQGIGFAIPIDVLRQHLPVMINKELELQRRLDFGLWVIDRQATETGGALPVTGGGGILVRSVRAESAAAQAGFEAGDLIREVDGVSVDSAIDFYLRMLERNVPSQVKFEVVRSRDNVLVSNRARQLEIDLPLQTRPKPDGKLLARRLMGLEVGSLSSRASRQYSSRAQAGNVVVESVERDSPAEQARIEQGDLIKAVDGVSINDIESLGLQLEMIGAGTTVELTIYRIQETIWGRSLFQIDLPLRTR